MSLHVVIMAGGSGTRLWPISRADMPKQLQKLVGEQTLIQQTYTRLRPLVDPEHIVVATAPKYVEAVMEQLPELTRNNVVTDPELKNTAAAIGLAAVHIYHRDKQGIMASFASDHTVQKTDNFELAVKMAVATVEKHPDHLMLVGLKPTHASTELGYIQMDNVLEQFEDNAAYEVKQFIEKPNTERAKELAADWHYLWNAAYFIWRVDTLLNLYKQFLPNTYNRLMAIEKTIDTPEYEQVLKEQYAEVDEIAIDYGILEHAPKIGVIPADLGWSDIGTWGTLHDILSGIDGNSVVSKGHHVHHDTENSLVFAGDKLVATVGLKDVIIVDTPDVLLVADKSKAAEVKKILDKLKAEGKHRYL